MKSKILECIGSVFVGFQPFYAGFGDKGSDVAAYISAGITENRIYYVNTQDNFVYRYDGKVKFTYELLYKYAEKVFPNYNKQNRLSKILKNRKSCANSKHQKKLNTSVPNEKNFLSEEKENVYEKKLVTGGTTSSKNLKFPCNSNINSIFQEISKNI